VLVRRRLTAGGVLAGLAVLVAALLALGCERAEKRPPRVELMSQPAIGVSPGQAAVVYIATKRSDSGEPIVGLVPEADPGLSVRYLGFASCRRGCTIARWNERSRSLVKRSLEGRFPLFPDGPGETRLMFLLRPTPRAYGALRRGCVGLRSVVLVTQSGGRARMINHFGAFVAGVAAGSSGACDREVSGTSSSSTPQRTGRPTQVPRSPGSGPADTPRGAGGSPGSGPADTPRGAGGSPAPAIEAPEDP
jgi:hypothetical protein